MSKGRPAEGTTFGYWTFTGNVPGPFTRVRVGDTVDIHLKNSAASAMIHSVDFHAATGPGGGAAALQVDPGGEKSMTWKALVPGLYVFDRATPMVAEHIANGMYGLILVEPEGGLPPVDHEFYVKQGEIYSDIAFGQHGSAEFSVDKLLNERPEYFVFNGSVGALTKLHPLEAKVGDTVRIFFGVGGPNYTSSFHVIGEIFDNLGGVTTARLEGIQTVTVPAGGAAITEFEPDVPGNYTLDDHALARMERGLLGVLHVEGPTNPGRLQRRDYVGNGALRPQASQQKQRKSTTSAIGFLRSDRYAQAGFASFANRSRIGGPCATGARARSLRKFIGLFSQPNGFLAETFFQRLCLMKRRPFGMALLPVRVGGVRNWRSRHHICRDRSVAVAV